MNLFDLFATINLDSSNYEQGMSDAENSASSLASKLKNGLGTAGKVGAAAITAVTAASTAAATALTKGASDLASYGDEIDKNSQKMGISAQAYQEWDAILQHSGSSISAMQKGMIKLQTAVASGSDVFEKLGLSQEEVASMSTEDLFAATIAGLQGMEEGSERTALAQELLGGAVKELGPLLNTSAEETEAMRKRVHELGGVLSDEAVKASAGFQDSLQDMQTAFAGIKNGILSDMLPGMTSLMNGFTSLIAGEEGAEEAISSGMNSMAEGITGAVNKFMEVGSKLIPALLDAIIDNLPAMAESGIMLIESIVSAIVNNLPKFVKAGLEIIQAIANSLSKNVPVLVKAMVSAITEIAKMLTNPSTLSGLLNAFVEIMTSLAETISDSIPELVEAFMIVIDNLVNFVMDNLPVFINAAVSIILALVDGFAEALPVLLEYLPQIITGIVDGLMEMLPQIIEAGVVLLTALVDNMPTILTTIAEKLPEIIGQIVGTITSHIPEIVGLGFTLFTALIDNLPEIIKTIVGELPRILNGILNKLTDMIPDIIMMGFDLLIALIEDLPHIIVELVKHMPEIISAIVGGLTAGIGSIVDVGVAIVEGLWDGIKSMGSWLWNKASGFIGDVVGGIADFLGIASPSKVFAEMGEMIDRGLVKGIEDYADLAVEAAEGMSDDVIDAVNTDLDFTANATSDTMGAGNRGGVVINVYGEEGQDVNELAEVISQKMAFAYSQEQAVWA